MSCRIKESIHIHNRLCGLLVIEPFIYNSSHFQIFLDIPLNKNNVPLKTLSISQNNNFFFDIMYIRQYPRSFYPKEFWISEYYTVKSLSADTSKERITLFHRILQ